MKDKTRPIQREFDMSDDEKKWKIKQLKNMEELENQGFEIMSKEDKTLLQKLLNFFNLNK